jgi:hypothetical protein
MKHTMVLAILFKNVSMLSAQELNRVGPIEFDITTPVFISCASTTETECASSGIVPP